LTFVYKIMFVSLGIDLVEVGRIRKALDRWGERFLHRIYTSKEIEYCNKKAFPEQSLAARFAAKEAVFKAMGIGLSGGMSWTQVEIINDPKGKPEVRVGPKVSPLIGNKKILLSISHTREFAIAQAVLVNDR
jgi:holo-[acyl-carrier protein] synthase